MDPDQDGFAFSDHLNPRQNSELPDQMLKINNNYFRQGKNGGNRAKDEYRKGEIVREREGEKRERVR